MTTNPGYDEHGCHPWDNFFIANEDGTFTCGPCIPDSIDPAAEEVEVWDVGGHGWLKPVVCHVCKISLEVYLDGEEGRSTNAHKEKEMTMELFTDELNRLESTFAFKNMLSHDPILQRKFKEDEQRVLVTYHAFAAACSKELLDNPLVIGGYMERALTDGFSLVPLVEQARQQWGRR